MILTRRQGWARRLGISFCWLFLAFFAMTVSRSQGRTGIISGTVQDSSGGPLPGVTVEAVKVDTGVKRMSITDGQGRYEIPALQIGKYQVTATLSGFCTSVQKAFDLTLDRQAVIDIRMLPGELHEEVTVSANPPLVDSISSAAVDLVDQRKVQQLPLNGRDIFQLAAIQSGVPTARAQGRGVNTGNGIQISIFGSRPVQNNFRLDGVSITDFTGSTPGSINGVTLGVDAIQEFTVLGVNYGAQYGRAAGGVVNVATRAGTNELRGTVFFFHRNDNLDARNFFDPEKPEFRRHQFGLSLGGPIVRGKTFFFANYESLREVRGNTQIDTTMSDSARAGVLRSGPVAVDPLVAKMLPLYPRANGEVLGDTGLFIFANDRNAVEDYASVRIDHSLGASDNLFARYTGDTGDQTDQTTFSVSDRSNKSDNHYFVLEESHGFSQTVLNTARLGVTRVRSSTGLTVARDPRTDSAELAFVPGVAGVGGIEVTGISTFPGGTNVPDYDSDAFTSLQLQNDLWSMHGAHSLKLGGNVERILFNADSQNRRGGEFVFPSLSEFLTNKPQIFRSQLPGSTTVRGWRQTLVGWYLQDDWKLRHNLTLNLGVRHEWTTVPKEVNGRIANLDELNSPEMRVGEPLYNNPSYDNFAPRVGIAWSPSRKYGTVVRAAYGIFHDQLLVHYLLLAGVRNPPFFLRGQIRNLQPGDFPSAAFNKLAAADKPELRVERLPQDINQPYVQQWNLTVEQPVGASAVARVAYVGSHGVHLTAIVEDANLVEPVILPDGRRFYPADGTKQNQVFGMIRNRLFDGQSFYHALQASVRRDWRSGFQSSVSYTFGKSIDDDSATFAHDEAANSVGIPVNGDHRFNRGPSNHDVTHNLTFHAIWQVPSPSRHGFYAVLGGWQLGALGTFSSGLPFSASLAYDAARTGTARPSRLGGQRPDLVPGASNNPVTGDPDRWFDPSAFARPVTGFLGNLGRNTLRGPNYGSVDLSLARTLPLPTPKSEGAWQLRIETFNLLNQINFALPEPSRTEVFGKTSVPEDVGRITESFASREIQIGLKLNF